MNQEFGWEAKMICVPHRPPPPLIYRYVEVLLLKTEINVYF